MTPRAVPLTDAELAELREWVRRGHKPWTYGADGVLVGHIDRLLATLEAREREGLDVERLRAAAQLMLDSLAIRDDENPDGWAVPLVIGTGPTPAAALRALAARLSAEETG